MILHIWLKVDILCDGRGGANTFSVRKYNFWTFHTQSS